jgi:hypothetical protein
VETNNAIEEKKRLTGVRKEKTLANHEKRLQEALQRYRTNSDLRYDDYRALLTEYRDEKDPLPKRSKKEVEVQYATWGWQRVQRKLRRVGIFRDGESIDDAVIAPSNVVFVTTTSSSNTTSNTINNNNVGPLGALTTSSALAIEGTETIQTVTV